MDRQVLDRDCFFQGCQLVPDFAALDEALFMVQVGEVFYKVPALLVELHLAEHLLQAVVVKIYCGIDLKLG